MVVIKSSNITNVTRLDIFELFSKGIEQDTFWQLEPIYYPYYGRFKISDFLNRLYDLSNIESYDPRFQDAGEDIRQGAYNNCLGNWVFSDERFGLLGGSDDIFLNFFCEVFHPEVRDEKKEWKLFLGKINELLNEDGYELYISKKLSGRDVFSWRKYIKKPILFIPFSKRNKSLIAGEKIKVSIPNEVRYQLYNIMNEYDETYYLTDENNWNYTKLASDFVLNDISKFYIPKYYVNGEYTEAKEFEVFIKGTSPFSIFDALESFSRNITQKEKFEEEINTIFKLNNINVELRNNEIYLTANRVVKIDTSIQIKEYGIEDLLRKSEEFYNKGQYSSAVEKIWDAFERIKTYYVPPLDKRRSAEKIIEDISCGNIGIKAMFDTEFKNLTDIGNRYRIRHHERDKVDISDDLHYEYFYNRCLSLILVLLKIIK